MASKVTTPCSGRAVDDAALRLCTNLARGGLARRGGVFFLGGVIIAAVPAAGPGRRGVASLGAHCDDGIDPVAELAAKSCSVRSSNPRHSLASEIIAVGDLTTPTMCSKGSGRGARRNVRNFPTGPSKDEDGTVLFLLGGGGGTRCKSSWESSFMESILQKCENSSSMVCPLCCCLAGFDRAAVLCEGAVPQLHSTLSRFGSAAALDGFKKLSKRVQNASNSCQGRNCVRQYCAF